MYTKGIKVWCAAGKGTFGTHELISKINSTHLASVVTHKNIILPQLGAVGVAAHIVAEKTDFKINFGPVRASDIKDYLKSNKTATDKMRTVHFGIIDRIVLIPVELVATLPKLIFLFGVLFILNLFNIGFALKESVAFSGAVFIGCVLTPILLPYIPFKAFSLKGAILGALFSVWLVFFSSFNFKIVETIVYFLLITSISAYLSLNFTGCSTYTSPSGVNKEMRFALPIIIISCEIGVLLFIVNIFVKGAIF